MRLFLLTGACCALAACATPAASVRISEGKAVAGAWASLQAASSVADAAVKAGKLKGSQAAAVADDLNAATRIITAADQAYQQNPGADVSAQVAQAAGVIAKALCIAKPTPGCVSQ